MTNSKKTEGINKGVDVKRMLPKNKAGLTSQELKLRTPLSSTSPPKEAPKPEMDREARRKYYSFVTTAGLNKDDDIIGEPISPKPDREWDEVFDNKFHPKISHPDNTCNCEEIKSFIRKLLQSEREQLIGEIKKWGKNHPNKLSDFTYPWIHQRDLLTFLSTKE